MPVRAVVSSDEWWLWAGQPTSQSWLPLFAVTGIRNDWQVKALYFVVSFFMIYAISDQLEVFPYLQTEDLGFALAMARVAAAVTGQDAPMADAQQEGKVMGFDTHTYPGDKTMAAWKAGGVNT
mgnify:CR=1 FL=1